MCILYILYLCILCEMLRTVRIFFKIANDGLGDSDCGSMRASFHSVVDGSVKADLSPALDDSARCLCHGRPDTLPCSTWRALRHLARLACSLCADVDCLLILSTAAPSGKQALIRLLSSITDESNNHVVIELNTPERERESADDWSWSVASKSHVERLQRLF